MKEITGTIKAFMRPHCMGHCIQFAIDAGIKDIMVGYDGPKELEDQHKAVIDSVLEHNKNVNIEFLIYPFNYGLSAVRNRLIEKVDTKYFFLLDDDNYIPSNSLEILDFMESKKDIGGVGIGWITRDGILSFADAYDLKIENDYLVRYFDFENKQFNIFNGNLYIYPFDFIPNCAIWRTEVFNEFKWDEKFIISREHEDFMLNLKLNSTWKLAIAANLFAVHDKKDVGEYRLYRVGKEKRKSIRYFLRKWNLKGIYPENYIVSFLNWTREREFLKRVHDEGLKKYKIDNIYLQ